MCWYVLVCIWYWNEYVGVYMWCCGVWCWDICGIDIGVLEYVVSILYWCVCVGMWDGVFMCKCMSVWSWKTSSESGACTCLWRWVRGGNCQGADKHDQEKVPTACDPPGSTDLLQICARGPLGSGPVAQ